MARNVEIKAKISDLAAVRAKAERLASAPAHIIQQVDTFFTVPRGRLKVREFCDGSGELIDYRRLNQHGPKESTYTRIVCEDARALRNLLSRILPVRGTVSKRRELFLAGRTRIHIDEVERLGYFLELEVVLGADESLQDGQREAVALLEALGVSDRDLVAEAYIDLLEGTDS